MSVQVLATSLSAMYSELPTVQPLTCDEWSSVTECVRHSVSSLSSFIDCLQFCNSVIQVSLNNYSLCVCVCVVCLCLCVCVCVCVICIRIYSICIMVLHLKVSPDEVAERILSLINDGFLQHVIGPALFQVCKQMKKIIIMTSG